MLDEVLVDVLVQEGLVLTLGSEVEQLLGHVDLELETRLGEDGDFVIGTRVVEEDVVVELFNLGEEGGLAGGEVET